MTRNQGMFGSAGQFGLSSPGGAAYKSINQSMDGWIDELTNWRIAELKNNELIINVY